MRTKEPLMMEDGEPLAMAETKPILADFRQDRPWQTST